MARRVNNVEAERFTMTYDQALLTAGLTVKLYKVPVGRALRITRVSYVNPTGLTASGTNAFALDIKNNTTSAAGVFDTNSSHTPAGVTLPVNTFVEGKLSATDANRVFAAGDTLSAVFAMDGTATLPAGHLVIEGLLL